MSFKKETINQLDPMKGQAIESKSMFVNNADKVWITAATKYPNGVFQSNGNLRM